ncbi:restriction endonuclease subunit S [Vibrio sp. 10N.237.312.B06]|uniref:restriction endonuclease subunit S n=1 Tax=Vibrio sp. 10N.237.312.B06 TaxID=3229974 RepID=UPI00354D101F
MSCNWPLKRISEVANFENNKRVPLKSLDREKRQGDYPYYGASGIVDYIDDFIFDGNYLLISEDGENLRTRNTPIAFQAKGKFWVNNHAHIFSEKEDGILDYLEYYFSVLNIGAYITGAVQPKLNKANLDKIEIPIPPLEERLKLNGVLNSFRDKSRLNRRINQTLEEMAQAVFKSWFVDFDPVKAKMNGEQPEGMDAATASLFPEKLDSETGIPVGWSQGVIADIAKLNAKSWTKKNQPEQVHYVDLANTKNGVIETVTSYGFSEAPSRARRILNSGDTIVGTVRPGNRSFAFIGDTEQPLTGSTGFAVLSPKEECWTSFVYLATTNDDSIDEYARLADGGAYPAIKPVVVADTPCAIPTKDIAQKFLQLTGSMLKKAHQNRLENEELAKLRDTLLPKLLSGEIDLEMPTEN